MAMDPRPVFGVASTSDTLNILDFQPALLPGDEVDDLDITSSLEQALKAVPKAHKILSDGDRVEHAATIMFPSLRTGAAYVLRRPIEVPGDRNVRLAATSPFGARIELRLPTQEGELTTASGLRPALQSLSGRRAHVFENLIFRGAGVTIGHAGFTVGMTEFRSCLFTDITNPTPRDAGEEATDEQEEAHLKWAISTAARGVVGVRIMNCQFVQTDHGVGVLHNGCDNWIIGENSRFVRMRGVGVEICSSGVTVQGARFENKLTGAASRPYVRVRGAGNFGGGKSEIVGCRFGGEVGLDFETGAELDGPPRDAIELGPNRRTAKPNAPLVGVIITHNRFLGRTRSADDAEEDAAGGPTEHSAVHAISLKAPVQHTIVANNHFARYLEALIEQTEESLVKSPESPTGLKSHSNLFVGNAVDRKEAPNGRPYLGLISGNTSPWQCWPPGQDEPL
jgi:hypothetical protein